MRYIIVLFLLLISTYSKGQIFNKWYQAKIITNDNLSLFTQYLVPNEFEITQNHINYFDPLNGGNYFSYDTKGNLFNNSINLFNTIGFSYINYHIDSITDCKLILNIGAAKIYYYKIINHDLKYGMFKLLIDKDTVIEKIKVLPDFRGNFTRLLLKNINSTKYVDTISKIVKVSFIIRNSGLVDSIWIDSCNMDLKKDINNFVLSTNKKWKIKRKFRNYSDNKFNISLIIASKTTVSATKNIFNSAAKSLFNKGCKSYKNNDFHTAVIYFTESILYSEYNRSIGHFHLNKDKDLFDIADYDNAIMNRAATYIKLNFADKACEDWHNILQNKMVFAKDKNEAKEYLDNICKK